MTEEKLTERDYEVLDACCELLSIKIDELKAENEKLNKILQEIKEIAETQINTRMLLADKKSFHKFRGIYLLATKAEEE